MVLKIVLSFSILFINLFTTSADQNTSGRLMGLVTDYSGKPVAGATVFVSGPTSKAVLTNAQGYYVFLTVPEGKYNMKVFKSGMPRLRTNKVYVPSKATLRRDFTFITDAQNRALLAQKEAERKRIEEEALKQQEEEKKQLLAEKRKRTPPVKPRHSIAPKAKPSEKPEFASAGSELNNSATAIESTSNDAITDVGLKAATKAAEEAEKNALAMVESQVEIEGGLGAVIKKINYPDTAKKLKIEGLVVARAYVDEEGRLTRIDLLKQAHALLDEEAVRVLSEETFFKPAQQDGKNVSGAITVPIKFRIAKVVW